MKQFQSVALLIIFAASPVFAQENQHSTSGRTPAQILKAEQASILLMDARDDLEHPETTLDLMGLKDGDVVADLGCGNGYYTLRIAKRIAPHGHVLAVDVQQGMLDQLTSRMEEAEIKNIYPILGAFTDPYLPPGKVDWLLLTDVYHEFSEPEKMLEKIRACLAPDGRVALLEYRAEQDPETIAFPIPRDHKMTVEEVMIEWVPAGFELVERIEVLPAQHIFIFKAGSELSSYQTVTVGDTSNVSSAGNGKYYFAGQPTEADLTTFAHMGVKTVLNIRSQGEIDGLGFDEAAAAEAAGMRYVNIPMGREMPSDVDLGRIFDELDKGEVLLHCASSNRVGGVWGMYQLKRGGLDIEGAIAAGKSAGMRAEVFQKAIEAAGE
ncbi:MAG: methyltransferase domain-containing protein [Candidatus Hydrogenedentota bacterium]